MVSADFQGLKPGKQRYGVLLNAEGGIIDDLMAARPDDDGLFVVVNGACKDNDFKVIADALAGEADDRAASRTARLLALQGPEAAAVLAAHVPHAAQMVFMDTVALTAFGDDVDHLALGLYRRGRLRDLRPGRRGRAGLEHCCWPMSARQGPSAWAPATA